MKRDNSSMMEKVRRKQRRGPPLTGNVGQMKGHKNDRKQLIKREKEAAVAIHGLGTDTRALVNQVPRKGNDFAVDPSSNATCKQIVTCNVQSLYSMAIGIVSAALKRGWLATVTDTSPNNLIFPYLAAVRLVQVFIGFMSGIDPTLSQAPAWIWMAIYALKPKVVRVKTGYISYAWSIVNNGVEVSIDHVMPSTIIIQGQYDLVLGSPTTSTFNGFPNVVPAGGYAPEDGGKALQSMFQIFSPKGLMADPGMLPTGRDTSSFAAVYPELGVSGLCPGSMVSTIYSETFIRSPIFAKFALYQSEVTNAWRGWNEAGVSGGTAGYILPRLSEMNDSKAVKNKTRPRFKAYNFDEFYDVLARACGNALEIQNADVGLPVPECPLTPLQVQLLLRQALLTVFQNELSQDAFFNAGPDGQTLPWFPFTVTSNGTNLAAQGAQMKLPTPLTENIRASSRHTEMVHTKFGDQISDVVTLLGRYDPAERPMLGNYTYSKGGVPTNVFANETLLPFNIIDCSYPGMLGTKEYFDLNADQYAILCEVWNEWIAKLSSFVGVATIAGEMGISALSTAFMTNHLVYQTPEIPQPELTQPIGKKETTATTIPTSAKLKKEKSVKHIGSSMKRNMKSVNPVGGPSYFDSTYVRLTSSTYPFLAPTSKFMNCFVLPIITAVETADQENTTSAIQSFLVEPYSRSDVATSSNVIVGVSAKPALTTRHVNLAAMCVRGVLSQTSEVMLELQQLAKEGRGGFFTFIARAVQGVTGLPVAGLGKAIDDGLAS